MEENTNTTNNSANSSAGKGLGIAGLVLGIVAAIIAFIPCLGTFALIPGIICSIVGCCLAGYQFYVLKTAGEKMKEGLEEINKSGALDSLNKAMEQLNNIIDTSKSQ